MTWLLVFFNTIGTNEHSGGVILVIINGFFSAGGPFRTLFCRLEVVLLCDRLHEVEPGGEERRFWIVMQ